MKHITFDEIATFSYGSMPDKELISELNGFPIWTGYLYAGYYPHKNIGVDDLIVVARGVGGTGDVKIAVQDCWLTNLSIKVHLVANSVLPKYLYYKFSKNSLRFLDSGSAQSQITINDLKKFQFNVHDLETQRHIINTIGSIDDLIENYQKEVDKICELLNKSLLEYGTKVEISKYNPTIIKSGIETFAGTKEYLDTSSIEGINNISNGEIIIISKRPSRANMQPLPNSVWFAKMKGSNKKLIITNNDGDLTEQYILSTGFQGVLASSKLPLSLLAAIVISHDFDVQRDLHSVGTTMAGINNDTFMRILVPYLTDDEVKEYDNKYSPFIALLSKRRKEITKLKIIKQQLLNKYF